MRREAGRRNWLPVDVGEEVILSGRWHAGQLVELLRLLASLLLLVVVDRVVARRLFGAEHVADLVVGCTCQLVVHDRVLVDLVLAGGT